jgi:uncharacterized glyoxalase superfamily protein PhnB
MSDQTSTRAHRERHQPESLRCRSMSVGLTVNDLQKSLAWYRDVAGFIVGETWMDGDEMRGASVLAGAVTIVLNQDDWAKGRDRVKGQGVGFYLSTAQDVDAVASAIKARGGKLASEPADMPWGTRAFSLLDPDGYKLTISSGEE